MSGNANRAREESLSVHVVFTDHNNEEVLDEIKDAGRAGIQSRELNKAETNELLPHNTGEIKYSYKYFGDTNIKFNINELN